MKTKAFQI